MKELKINSNLLKRIYEYLESFIKSHEEFVVLNKRFKIQNKNQYVNPMKPHVLILHNEITEKFNLIKTQNVAA